MFDSMQSATQKFPFHQSSVVGTAEAVSEVTGTLLKPNSSSSCMHRRALSAASENLDYQEACI